MKLKRFYFLASLLIIALGFSAYYSKKLKEEHEAQTVVVVQTSPIPPPVVASPTPEPTPHGVCEELPEFKNYRRELGLVVNDHITRNYQKAAFLKKIDGLFKTQGLPMPLAVDGAEAAKENIVYNNCQPACSGKVHQVFVAGVEKAKSVTVLARDGKLKRIPLNTAGVEVLQMDELNKKGEPFRSWALPVVVGPWYLKGNYLYVTLDIEGLWLRVDSGAGVWSVVFQDPGAARLTEVEPLSVAGCNQEEICLASTDGKRHFKIPKACASH